MVQGEEASRRPIHQDHLRSVMIIVKQKKKKEKVFTQNALTWIQHDRAQLGTRSTFARHGNRSRSLACVEVIFRDTVSDKASTRRVVLRAYTIVPHSMPPSQGHQSTLPTAPYPELSWITGGPPDPNIHLRVWSPTTTKTTTVRREKSFLLREACPGLDCLPSVANCVTTEGSAFASITGVGGGPETTLASGAVIVSTRCTVWRGI
jgi:hypothetical protein